MTANLPRPADAASYRAMRGMLDEQSRLAEIPHVWGTLLCLVEYFALHPDVRIVMVRRPSTHSPDRAPEAMLLFVEDRDPAAARPHSPHQDMEDIMASLHLRSPRHAAVMPAQALIHPDDGPSQIARKLGWTALSCEMEALEISRHAAAPSSGRSAKACL